jgi:hypothetical protein
MKFPRGGEHRTGDGEVGDARDGDPMLVQVLRTVPTGDDPDIFTGTS